jgi:hypothetical protein
MMGMNGEISMNGGRSDADVLMEMLRLRRHFVNINDFQGILHRRRQLSRRGRH